MKTFRIRTLAIVFISAVCMSGCANTKGYFADRIQDAGDIFTATVGVGAGATAKFGPLNLGLLANKDMAGLRSGALFINPQKGDQYDILALGATQFEADGTAVGRAKKVDDIKILGFSGMPTGSSNKGTENLFQIEVVAGMGPSVRLGFNPAEILDFAFGWFGIDIFGDDVNSKALLGNRHNSRQISYLSAETLQ